jgi:hypothetical protein
MRAIGRLGLCVVALVLALPGTGEAQTEAKNKQVPCGDADKGECKLGTESKPDVPCQYQMNEPNGLVEVLLLPK